MDQQTNLKGINLDDVQSIHSYQPLAKVKDENQQIMSPYDVETYIKLEAKKQIGKQIQSVLKHKLQDDFINQQIDVNISKYLDELEQSNDN